MPEPRRSTLTVDPDYQPGSPPQATPAAAFGRGGIDETLMGRPMAADPYQSTGDEGMVRQPPPIDPAMERGVPNPWAPDPRLTQPGSLTLPATDPSGSMIYAGGGLGPPAPVSRGFLQAVSGDISDMARGIWAAGSGTLEQFATGRLQPGTPEAAEAARTTAMTYGLPGGAPGEALSAGVRIPRAASNVRRSRDALLAQPGELEAPMIGMGSEAPMFDLSQLSVRPNEPQLDLPRYQMPTGLPPKGVPVRYTEAMMNPENRARFLQMVEMGRQHGLGWYGTQPLRQAFKEELGEEAGKFAFRRYLDYVGATSPRSKVGENIRNASYYFGQERRGEPVIETALDPGRAPALVSNLPQPYGHMAQRLHVQNVRNLRGMDPVGSGAVLPGQTPIGILDPAFPIVENPKPPSFTANLGGNWQPITADVHNVRAWGLSDIPGKTGYGYMEDVQQAIARDLGMDPAQLQASAWVGGELPGELTTGVKSGSKPFMAHFEDRVRQTARFHGESPQETMRKFLRGERDLLQAGDISGVIGSGAAQAGRQQEPEQ